MIWFLIVLIVLLAVGLGVFAHPLFLLLLLLAVVLWFATRNGSARL